MAESDAKTNGENKEYSYDEAVELTGHGRYHYVLLAATSIISHSVAVDLFGFSVVVAASACDLHLGIMETGYLASTPFIGALFTVLWGLYADRQGRKRALVLCTSFGFVFAALSSFSPNWIVLMILKLIGCIFTSSAYTLTMTYVGECTGSQRRSRYIFILFSACLSAELVFFSLAYFLLPLDISVPVPWLSITFRPWRLYSLVMSVPLCIGAGLLLFLHESPKFLANKGETEKALEVLRIMYETNGGNKDDYPVKSLKKPSGASTNRSAWYSVVADTVPLFKPPMLWRTLQLMFLTAVCNSTNNIFLMWYPMMVNMFFNSFGESDAADRSFCERLVDTIHTNISGDSDGNYASHSEMDSCSDTVSSITLYSGMLLGLVFLLLGLLAAAAASWRRLVLISSLMVPAVCLMVNEIVRNPVANLIVFTLVQCTVLGMGSVLSFLVDLYPTSCRGQVTSLAMLTGRLVSLVGVNLIGGIIVDHCNLVFYIAAAFVWCGIIVALFLPADSKTKIFRRLFTSTLLVLWNKRNR